MSSQPQTYERLPGRGRQLLTIHSLWLGPDHLLSVSNSGYAQEYKRFYFSDIQAFLVRHTDVGKVWNILWSFLTAIFASISLGGPLPEVWWPLVPTFFFLLCLQINLIRGPTCTSHIRTAVQTELLPSLNRLKNTRRVLQQLTPVITSAQAAAYPSSAPPTGSAPQDVPPVLPPDPTPPGSPESSGSTPAVS